MALAAIVTVVSLPSVVLAQEGAQPGVALSRANSIIVAPTPMYSDYHMPYFSSTNGEGLGRGLGALVHGIGQMNLYNSMAAANFEEARRRSIENRRLSVETYFSLRRTNEQYREAQLRSRPKIHTAQVNEPARPMPNRIDLVTGAIQWPKPLQAGAYSTARQQLESLFSLRSETNTDQGAVRWQHVQELTQAMKHQLKTEIHAMSPSDYVTAKKFIEGLADDYESRSARRPEQLAAR
jgi:hypothetical protein